MAERLTWQQKLDEIQRRQSEANLLAPSAGLDVPFFLRSDIEQILWEVSNAKLGSLSVEEIGNCDSSVTQIILGASPIVLPKGMIDIVTATIDGGACVEVDPAHYYWVLGASGKYFSVMKNIGTGARSIYHSGATAEFAILTEAPLASWQANLPILPPAYDEECINEVCVLLEIEDFVEDPFRRTLQEKKELVT